MDDWKYAETEPSQKLSRLHQFSFTKVQPDREVEIIITGRSAELARRGIAEQLRLPDAPQTVYGLMQDAHRAGVVFKVCAPAPGLGDDDLVPEIDETVGGAYLISEAMDDATVTLTY